jgi:hypothetical protein
VLAAGGHLASDGCRLKWPDGSVTPYLQADALPAIL